MHGILQTEYGLVGHDAVSSIGAITVPFTDSTKSPATVVALAGCVVTSSSAIRTTAGALVVDTCQDEFAAWKRSMDPRIHRSTPTRSVYTYQFYNKVTDSRVTEMSCNKSMS